MKPGVEASSPSSQKSGCFSAMVTCELLSAVIDFTRLNTCA